MRMVYITRFQVSVFRCQHLETQNLNLKTGTGLYVQSRVYLSADPAVGGKIHPHSAAPEVIRDLVGEITLPLIPSRRGRGVGLPDQQQRSVCSEVTDLP
jgi:hypothetical protein